MTKLIQDGQLSPEDIVVLIVDSNLKKTCYDMLKKHPLPRPCKWMDEPKHSNHHIRIESVHRFKGLEAQAVILWGLDDIKADDRRELFYVALSRPKSELHLVGRIDERIIRSIN